jgi:hypothetical protein
MSFEAESNTELTVIVPAYQLHFRFPVQNKIHKQNFFVRHPDRQVLHNFSRSCRKLLGAGPMSCILNFFFKKSDSVVKCHSSNLESSLINGSVVMLLNIKYCCVQQQIFEKLFLICFYF